MRGIAVVAAVGAGLASPEASAQTVERRAVAVQAGWWSIEGEVRSSIGLFADVGVPWVGFVLGATTSGTEWVVPLEAKVGFEHPVARQVGLRAGVRGALNLSSEDPCGTGCTQTERRAYLLAEIGVRWEHPSGFVVGLDVPLYVTEPDFSEDWPPPAALAFSQGYVGWRWGF